MAFCNQCGAALPEDARFCAVCGKPVAPAQPAPAAPVTMPCSTPIPEKKEAPVPESAAAPVIPADVPQPAADEAPLYSAAADPTQPVTPLPNPADFTQPVAPQPNPADFTQPVAPQPNPADFTQPVTPQPNPADFTQPVTPQPNPADFTQPVTPGMNGANPYLDPNFSANGGALFDTYGAPVKKKKNRTGLIIALVAVLLVLFVLLGLFLLGSLGGNDEPDEPASLPDTPVFGETAEDAAATTVVDQMLNGVVLEDPLRMFRTFYEFSESSDAELQDYIDGDFSEYGYADAGEQVDDWFDIFVWRYCPTACNLKTGVDDVQLLSLALSDNDPADGEYVSATATIVVDGAEVSNQELELTFSMVRENGQWYVVNYDRSIAYELMGDADPIYEHCEYMFHNMFNYANSENSSDLLYFFYDLYIDSYDNNVSYMNNLLDTYGGSEADFSNRLINRFLYLSGYSKNGAMPDGVDFEVVSFSMEDIPADYEEETFLDATAEVTVRYADGSSETANIQFQVTYYYGYWLVVLGES